jgi:ABC-type branched-subunit amino acid transport system permease subunit
MEANMKNNKTLQYILIGAALIALPLILQIFGNAWVRIADMALLYILLAIGLNIVVGYAGLLDLGYVAFFAVGAYMYGLLSSPHLFNTFRLDCCHLPDRHAHADLADRPCGGGAGGFVRHVAGRAHAQVAR